MKKYLIFYLHGLLIGLGFLTILGIGYFALKARQTTNPGLSDDGQGMYATAGTTLTAAKWNNMMDKIDSLSQTKQITASNAFTVASTSLQDTDMVITTEIKGNKALLIFNSVVRGTAGYTIGISFNIDGTDTPLYTNGGIILANSRRNPIGASRLVTGLTPGTHTFKVRANKNGGATAYLGGPGGANRTFQVIPLP